MNEKLKICPFCGDIPQTKIEITSTGGNSDKIEFSVFCEKCKIRKTISLSIKYYSTFIDVEKAMKLAIEEWNRRINNE